MENKHNGKLNAVYAWVREVEKKGENSAVLSNKRTNATSTVENSRRRLIRRRWPSSSNFRRTIIPILYNERVIQVYTYGNSFGQLCIAEDEKRCGEDHREKDRKVECGKY